jgi:acyl-coenzyme A synthetase/AMP-(fatty) acid ligase
MAAPPPWFRFYGGVPTTLDYPQIALCDAVMASVRRVPDVPAFAFLGTTATSRELGKAIDRCAATFAALGMRQGDRITISLPTSPQGIIWSCPREMVFRPALPKARLGKNDSKTLSDQERSAG